MALRGVVELPEDFSSRLLDGARAFPPADCGGVGGYCAIVELLRTGKDPHGREPDALRDWVGDWEPERFKLEAVRRRFDRGPAPKALYPAKKANK